jgi:ABC-type transport system substrate-binding protein
MKQFTRRDFLRLSTVAAAGTLAAACAKTEEPTPKPKAAATATPVTKKDEPTPEPVAVWPRGEVPRNRTLIRMFGGPPADYVDVGIGHGYAMTHQTSLASQLEAMFYFSALGDKTYPHLAESAEYNDDATELTI